MICKIPVGIPTIIKLRKFYQNLKKFTKICKSFRNTLEKWHNVNEFREKSNDLHYAFKYIKYDINKDE